MRRDGPRKQRGSCTENSPPTQPLEMSTREPNKGSEVLRASFPGKLTIQASLYDTYAAFDDFRHSHCLEKDKREKGELQTSEERKRTFLQTYSSS